MAFTGLHDMILRNGTTFLLDNNEMDIRKGWEMAGSFHKEQPRSNYCSGIYLKILRKLNRQSIFNADTSST
jgi:hypothetical protein